MAYEIVTREGEVYYELEGLHELRLLLMLYLNELECEDEP